MESFKDRVGDGSDLIIVGGADTAKLILWIIIIKFAHLWILVSFDDYNKDWILKPVI